jgi:hypothetical protein
MSNLIKFCPINTNSNEIINFCRVNNIPRSYLGFELLANDDLNTYGGFELKELTHLFLIMLYEENNFCEVSTLEVLIKFLNHNINESIQYISKNKFKLDSNSVKTIIHTNNVRILSEYLDELLLKTINFPADQMELIQKDNPELGNPMVKNLRLIEYASFLLINNSLKSFLDYFRISSSVQNNYLNEFQEKGLIGEELKSIIAIVVPPNLEEVKVKKRNVNKFVGGMLPEIRVLGSFIKHDSVIRIPNFKQLINVLDITSSNSVLDKFKDGLKDGDIKNTVTLELFTLACLLSWKTGLAWIPVIGEMLPFMDDGPLGRIMGLGVTIGMGGFLQSNGSIKFEFVPQALIATPKMRIFTILYFGIALGGILAV